MLDHIFSILYQGPDSNIIHTGTGFLVSSNGVFATTGHTFRKKEKDFSENKIDLSRFKALFPIDNKLNNIKKIWYKSFEFYQQKSPEYFDIAIGQLELNNDKYLILDRRRPNENTDLKAVAYIMTGNIKILGTKFTNLNYLDRIEQKTFVTQIEYHDALISDLPKDYTTSRGKVAQSRFFNNCITVKNKFSKGASGCPVFNSEELVIGILIGSPIAIKETHILLAKHCSKMIMHNTYYNYHAYEYLSV